MELKLDADTMQEHYRLRDYLDKPVESLKQKLTNGAEVHSFDGMRIMQGDVSLIRESIDQRRDINFWKHVRSVGMHGEQGRQR